MENIQTILASSSHTSPFFNFIIEVLLHSGSVRTVGHGFKVNSDINLKELRTTLEGYIENFETQSGCPEERQEQEGISSLIKVFDRSHAPLVNWSASTPLTGLPESKISPETPKVSKRTSPKATAEKLAVINSQINLLSSDIKTMTSEIVQAIKTNPIPTQPPILSGVNWTPLLQGLANVVVTSIGGTTQFPTAPTPASTQPPEVVVTQIKELIKAEMSPLATKISSLESALTTLVQAQTELTKGLSNLSQTTDARFDRIASLMEAQIKASSTSSGGSSNGGGSSSAPAFPALNGNIIKTSNGVKTRILEERIPSFFV